MRRFGSYPPRRTIGIRSVKPFDCNHSNQISSCKARTRTNSPIFAVTRTAPEAQAWPAMNRSFGPIGLPEPSNSPQMTPYWAQRAHPLAAPIRCKEWPRFAREVSRILFLAQPQRNSDAVTMLTQIASGPTSATRRATTPLGAGHKSISFAGSRVSSMSGN